jgi:hypothetical protein
MIVLPISPAHDTLLPSSKQGWQGACSRPLSVHSISQAETVGPGILVRHWHYVRLSLLVEIERTARG